MAKKEINGFKILRKKKKMVNRGLLWVPLIVTFTL